MFLIRSALQRYDWGSLDAIPELLGFPPDGFPYAEAWWGAHPAAPAKAMVNGTWRPLNLLIDEDPQAALGPEVIKTYGERLPYLLKVLAVERPLSIQVHPSAKIAKEGFAREEAEGVPMDSPLRSYRDESHKPEMCVAITPMVVMSGFRDPSLVAADLESLGGPLAARFTDLLGTGGGGEQGMNAFLRGALMDPDVPYLVGLLEWMGQAPGVSPNVAIASYAAGHFPEDPGAIVALAMNVIQLEPGEACFTPDGMVHSFQWGVGLEIMAASDNVIRAGLTNKHVDVPALLEVARTAPSLPPRPEQVRDDGTVTYITPANEFRLAVVADSSASFGAGPRIVVVIDDEATLSAGSANMTLKKGEAAFVPYSDGQLSVVCSGRVGVASVPL